MEKIKYSMLFLHLWGAWMDLFVSILSVPVFFFPILSGYALGIMYYILPTWLICYIGFVSVLVLGSAIVMFFENRYNYLVRTDSEQFSRKIKRGIHHVAIYISAILIPLIPFLDPQEIPEFREIAHQQAPCLPSTIIDHPRFYMLNTDVKTVVICLLLYLITIFSQCTVFFVLTALSVFKVRSVSNQTARLQQQFFKALCIQVAIPLIIVLVPGVYIIYAYYTNHIDVMMTNITIAWFSTHGLFSTVVMLRVHKPYQNAVLVMFRLKKVETTTYFSTTRIRSSIGSF